MRRPVRGCDVRTSASVAQSHAPRSGGDSDQTTVAAGGESPKRHCTAAHACADPEPVAAPGPKPESAQLEQVRAKRPATPEPLVPARGDGVLPQDGSPKRQRSELDAGAADDGERAAPEQLQQSTQRGYPREGTHPRSQPTQRYR